MTYSIGALSRLSGVSARTLRYYGSLGLLPPTSTSEAGYRAYDDAAVDRLQEILLFRAMDVPLATIAQMLRAGYDRASALQAHLARLRAERERCDALIANVEKTLLTLKGATTMTDQEKFEGFKRKLVSDNEAQYGAEARALYGDAAIDASNEQILGLSPAQAEAFGAAGRAVNDALVAAVASGDPQGPEARRLLALHRQWLGYTWKGCTDKGQRGLCELYVCDPRFTAYYEAVAPGGAQFLADAARALLKD